MLKNRDDTEVFNTIRYDRSLNFILHEELFLR